MHSSIEYLGTHVVVCIMYSVQCTSIERPIQCLSFAFQYNYVHSHQPSTYSVCTCNESYSTLLYWLCYYALSITVRRYGTTVLYIVAQ